MKMSMDAMNIIVLGASDIHFSIIKNLAGHGAFTFHIFSDKKVPGLSNDKSEFHLMDFGAEEEAVCVLTEFGDRQNAHNVIIPATDAEVLFLDRNRVYLSEKFILSIPSSEVLRTVTDKFQLHGFLTKKGLTSPRSILIMGERNLEQSLDGLVFPCIVKPVYSNEWKSPEASELIGPVKAIEVRDIKELGHVYKKVKQISNAIIVQEIIRDQGQGNYSFCSYSDCSGNIIHGFVTEKLVQYPCKFGTAVLCRTVSNREVYEYGEKVIKAIGLEGIAEVEIIPHPETGEMHVIEINPRHWMQHGLSTALGVNYSLLDIYYRLGRMDEVNECLKKDRFPSDVIWVDEIGYLAHSIKNIIHPHRMFLNKVLKNRKVFFRLTSRGFSPFLCSLGSPFLRNWNACSRSLHVRCKR